jgi:hypothetical protein
MPTENTVWPASPESPVATEEILNYPGNCEMLLKEWRFRSHRSPLPLFTVTL